MKAIRWQYRMALALLSTALVFYIARWFIFPGEALHNEMWRFLVGDIAFLFIQVPLVTMVIDGLIRRREREEMRQKLNMVIGAFFSETGANLLGQIARADVRLPAVLHELIPSATWTKGDYLASRAAFRNHLPQVELAACDLERLHVSLEAERSFLIGLLANQTLMEHETFSDLLWALTHLGEELAVRPDLGALGPADAAHIAIDVKRAYTLLGLEWLSYLEHLQEVYPFLFSLAVRTNPLDPEASVVVG